MAPLKLVNNTGLESEANLCFVNSTLQLLNSIAEFKQYFVDKEYRQGFPEKLPISDELSRILLTDGRFATSAAQLRLLVGTSSGKYYLCDGSQQDILEFHQTLLQELEKELTMVNPEASRFLSRFWGREANAKKFLSTKEGFCKDCRRFPRREEEDFNVLQLHVIGTERILSLDSLIQNKYSEDADTIKMRCGNCPSSKVREVVSKTSVLKSPDFLYIQLLRFPHFDQPKVETIIVPENEIVLPNGDKFKLLSIADHLGDLIANGHFETYINYGVKWARCNDDKLGIANTNNIGSKHNYIFLYYKIDKTSEFVPTNIWEQVYPTNLNKLLSPINFIFLNCGFIILMIQ